MLNLLYKMTEKPIIIDYLCVQMLFYMFENIYDYPEVDK